MLYTVKYKIVDMPDGTCRIKVNESAFYALPKKYQFQFLYKRIVKAYYDMDLKDGDISRMNKPQRVIFVLFKLIDGPIAFGGFIKYLQAYQDAYLGDAMRAFEVIGDYLRRNVLSDVMEVYGKNEPFLSGRDAKDSLNDDERTYLERVYVAYHVDSYFRSRYIYDYIKKHRDDLLILGVHDGDKWIK